MTIELLDVAEAAIARTRDGIERRATSRVVRVFNAQAKKFPAQAVAALAVERFGTTMREAADDDLLDIITAEWPDGTERLAAVILSARTAATELAGNLTLATIGYEDAFSVGDAVAQRIEDGSLASAQGIDEFSRRRMRDVLSQGVARGDGSREIARSLRSEMRAWTRKQGEAATYRAETIARTEVAEAWGSTSHEVLARNGWAARKWITAKDNRVDFDGEGPCSENEAAGPVPIDQPFPSGNMWPPVHPRCRCTTAPADGFGPSQRPDTPWAGE